MLCVVLRIVDSCLVFLQWKSTGHLVCGTFLVPLHNPPHRWSLLLHTIGAVGDIASFGRNNAYRRPSLDGGQILCASP